MNIPNLTVSMGTAVTTTSCTEVPIMLTWNENRFNDVESTAEQFSYTFRNFCRPVIPGEESAS